MSIKDLLVTFVTSEEASIAQRSVMSMGATLSIVLAVAILTIGLAAQSAYADVWSCCSGAGGTMDPEYRWVDSQLCNPNCLEQRQEKRYCCSEPSCGCTDWQPTGNYRVFCAGQPVCYGRCADCI